MLTATEAMELQRLLDHSDPFFVEHLQGMSIDELMTEMQRLTREVERIDQMENPSWSSHARKNLDIATAMYKLKCASAGENREGHAVV